MTDQQKKQIINLLWDYLKKGKTNSGLETRATGWGYKTEEGLIACLESILKEEI